MMGTKVYDNALDLITFTRASGGTALRRIGYGSELVTNGTFDTNTTGWTASSATLSVDTNRLKVAAVSTYGMAGQAITTVIGKTYRVSVDATNNNATNMYLFVGTALDLNAQNYDSGALANGTRSASFVATATTTWVKVLAQGSGLSAFFDNISVKEVLFDQPDGTLTLFNHPNNIPRIEYAADGAVKGLLIEEQRTNLLTYSEDFANAAWTAGALNLTSISANRITPNTTLGQHRYDRTTTISASAHTFSVEAKPDGYSFLWLRLGAINGTFNLDTGEVTLSSGGTASSVAVGGGYFRVSISGTAAGNDTARINVLPTASTADFSGDGTSGVLVRNAQLEAGSFPTSYIPTSGATATRSADIASIPVTDFGYNQKAGSVVVEFETPIGNAGYIGDQTFSSALAYSSSSDFKTFNGTSAAGTSNTFALNQTAKGAVAYGASGRFVCLDGGTVGSTSGEVQSITTFKFGQAFGGSYLNGHIKSIQYYPRRLSNAQLQELTS